MRLDVFTLFPEAFAWFAQQVHVARARTLGVELNLWDYRATTPLRHGQVDDTPYGGGAGMVLRIDVVCAALEAVFGGDAATVARERAGSSSSRPAGVSSTTRWPPSSPAATSACCAAATKASTSGCRTSSATVSPIGPYVLSGGELAAQVLLDAVVRKIDGAVSNPESVAADSFSPGLGGFCEHPHYTRPAEFRGWSVPPVLLSGDHAAIARWRRERLGGGERPGEEQES